MITIPRSLLKRLRVVFGRALGLTARSSAALLTFQPHDGGVRISVVGSDVALTYQHPLQATFDALAVPYDLLKRCEGTKDDPVTLSRQNDEIIAEWTDAGIPQVSRFAVAELEALPPTPDTMQSNRPELLSALRDAVETTDRESTRYALNCLRLRGRDGQIAATDGRQLLVQDGFSFPWEGELLIPASRVFGSAEFSAHSEIEIGETDDWVTFRAGAWTVHLKIEKEARFPQVDHHIPQATASASMLHLSDADAEFLSKAVSRLPASGDYNAPVTVDLNGAIAIRAKGDDQPTPTELVLTASRRDGDPVKFNTNREFLARAARLGFRSVQVVGPETPVCCRDQSRSYVWALLGKDGIIPSDPDMVRIESPGSPSASRIQPTPTRKAPIPMNNSPKSAQRESQPAPRAQTEAPTIIAQAEAVRDTLAQALSQTRELIASLKQRKKQSRLVRSTLASLRQLETVDV
ncbi:MAG: hypothetical protein KF777_24790 [Planctomycetaceae bacterium]|nr:hypothetical protein [Planctomycetaceae bacterium]